MRCLSALGFSAVLSVALTQSTWAFADDAEGDSSSSRLPVAIADRPLTTPKHVLDIASMLDATRQSANAGVFANLDLRATFGITDDFEVRALVAPLQLGGPTNAYSGRDGGTKLGQLTGTRGPGAGLEYRFVRGILEVGVAADFRVFTLPDLSGANVTASVPIRLHPTRHLRIAFTPSLEVTRGTREANITGIGSSSLVDASINSTRVDLPVALVGNVSKTFYLGVNSGLVIYDLQATTETAIPLGATMGFTIPGNSRPAVDIAPYFNFPYLFLPGAQADTKTNAGQYVVGVNVQGFLYL